VREDRVIEVRGLCKSYAVAGRPVVVLDRVDLDVADGEMVAITGSSGSGKSTLLNVLGLLDAYDTGTYHLGGMRVRALSEAAAARFRNACVGFVFQAFHLIQQKTALENVALPLYYAGVARRERERRGLLLLERVGLGHRAHHLPSQLSGGQKQRVAIARALVTEPRVVLADEPTGALDSVAGDGILALLEALNRAGTTLVVVTHDPGVAARCQRTVTLKDGRVAA
jgi:putative ABC transport system ATP-binding protein